MKNKIVNLVVEPDVFINFLHKGTVIDRPGYPLLKIVDTEPTSSGQVSVVVEISATRSSAKNPYDLGGMGSNLI